MFEILEPLTVVPVRSLMLEECFIRFWLKDLTSSLLASLFESRGAYTIKPVFVFLSTSVVRLTCIIIHHMNFQC